MNQDKKKEILFVVLEEFADWEIAYVASFLNESDKYITKIVGINDGAIKSIGGLRVLPDYTVKNVPGGEFLTNVKLYILNGEYFVVHGDVWGAKGVEKQFKGWKIGDRVQYKDGFTTKKGTIVDLKNSEEASVKEDESGKVKNIKYEKLTKDI